MTKVKTFTTADVCEEAHKQLKKECRKLKIPVDCLATDVLNNDPVRHCLDENNEHGDDGWTHYTEKAQNIFNNLVDDIEEEWRQKGMVNEFDL